VRLTVAPDGRTGLHLAQALRPRLVLLDLGLPDIDGMEVLRQLRAVPHTRAIPVLVLSASAMPDEVAAARAAGADGFWPKPFDFHDFLAGLQPHLQGDDSCRAPAPPPRP
jgi:CheY-like chemotaxis protein